MATPAPPDALALMPYLRANPTDDTAWLAYADAIEESHPHFAEHVRAVRGVLPGAALTCFGGALVRVAPNQYQWRDGTAEPRVRAGTISAHNFRCGGGHVLVPRPATRAAGNPELRWVHEGYLLGWYPAHNARYDSARDPYLVPLAEWDAHAAALPCSVEWDRADEPAILALATSHGAQVPTERRASTA